MKTAPAKPKYTPPRGISLAWEADREAWRVGWRDDEGRRHFQRFPSRAAAEERAKVIAAVRQDKGREADAAGNTALALELQSLILDLENPE